METFTFQACIDAKGRVTIPASVRNRLDLNKDEQITLSVQEFEVIRKEVSRTEALEIVSSMEAESLSYSNGVLEVVKNE